jgi:RNA polymerase sigma-70 factor, ECF subfamily
MALAPDSETTDALLASVRRGDTEALDRLLSRYRAPLRRMVQLRLDPQLRQRVDPSDIVQEAKAEALRRLPQYLEHPAMPFALWLRRLTYEQLLMMRRRHIEAQRRTVRRELPLPQKSSFALAEMLLDGGLSPSEEMAARELARRVREALTLLPENDRDILLMRNFEGLSNQDAALVLGIDPLAASKRYGRALLRLRKILQSGGLSEGGL